MPYSVSPRCRDQIVGPKPTMNWGTRMPNANATMPRMVSRVPVSSASGDDAPGVLPGPLLRRQHVVDAGGDAEVRRVVEGTRDQVDDAPERQATRHEGRHRLLVGRVEQRRDDATGLPRRPGQADGREGGLVERGELPGA